MTAAPTPTVQIADCDEALTFARTGEGPARRLLAVTSYEQGRVRGVDVSHLAAGPDDDAIDLVNRLGVEALKAAIKSAKETVEVSAADLGMPVNLASQHIAVGTNYPEHADESSVVGDPFLFAKLVEPSAPNADIPCGEGLLDHEVELCLVPLTPLGKDDPATGGLILGNDVTDRAMLLRNADVRDVQSGRGFTTGKSAPGFLPVGDLFVVPRDLRAFVGGLTLTLSVNGRERQSAPATDWIWDLDEIVRQARLKRDVTWDYRNGVARLPFTADGAIPARTLIMAGTPAGTIFHGIPGPDRLSGALRWLLSGLRSTLVSHVVERYIKRTRASRLYLQPGDQVSIRVDRLGRLSNRVSTP